MIIHEIACRRITPYIKGIVVHKLNKTGFSQRRIAFLFGVSQPQIHKYLSKDISYYYSVLESYGFTIEEINRFINILIDLALKDEIDRFLMVFSSITDHLARLYICMHDERFIDYCRGKGRILDPYIVEYEDALKRIMSIKEIYRFIPEVGSNLVYAPGNVSNHNEVIGLPGRLVRADHTVVALGEPIYGGSRHTASILLIAQRHDPSKHVAMNIRYTDLLCEVYKSKIQRYRIIECGPHEQGSFWSDIEECMKSRPHILCDKGGHGLEPITYIIAQDFDELLDIIEQIVT